MSGMLQTSFYFGYMAVVAYGYCPTRKRRVLSALVFVRKIYTAIKADKLALVYVRRKGNIRFKVEKSMWPLLQ